MARKIPTDTAAFSYEAALARIRQIADRLQTGQAGLEESMRLYEEGQTLLRSCQQYLDQAELQVTRLLADGTETPLDEAND